MAVVWVQYVLKVSSSRESVLILWISERCDDSGQRTVQLFVRARVVNSIFRETLST